MESDHFLLFVGVAAFAFYFPWIFDWEDKPKKDIDYWSSNSHYSTLACFGFPILSATLVFSLLFLIKMQFDGVLTVLIFWTSSFAMFTGVMPLPGRSFSYVYNRRKALWVGFLQFLIACFMVCLIVIFESQ